MIHAPPLRFHWLWERRRRALLARAQHPAMADYLSHSVPRFNADVRDTQVLALDLETTGLDPAHDHIVSLGSVTLWGGHIHLDSAWYQLVQPHGPLNPDSVTIHRITDDEAADGAPLTHALLELLALLRGKVLLVHCAALDVGMLQTACRRVFGQPLLVPVIDTLALELSRYRNRAQTPKSDGLRLGTLRERYGLPEHSVHHAQADALATGELFLAQLAHLAGEGPLPLRSLLS